MMEIPEEAYSEWCDERDRKRYRSALMAHPHPADPDHPDPEEYGLEDDDE